MRTVVAASVAALISACASAPPAYEGADDRSAAPPNVLLICVDDLRPELGCYGSIADSPNIDALASQGVTFRQHFVALPTCGASRAAMLTGRAPTRPAHWGNGAFGPLRAADANVSTLPAVFRAAGYRTICLGKVSHTHDGRLPNGQAEVPNAWDEMPTEAGPWGEARHLLHAYADGRRRQRGKSPLTEAVDGGDEVYPDGRLAGQAVAWLRQLSTADDRPFFFAVGFFKPHLPFAAPRRYWDRYDPAALPLARGVRPAGLGEPHACRQSGEVTGNYACPQWRDRRWDDAEQRAMRHAYLACVSYVDAQVGKVLDELDRSGLADDTIVVLWGDHGWHLGEQGLMGKHTTFDHALQSPLIVRAPGRAAATRDDVVSSFDLFPTLCALAGVPQPAELGGRDLFRERGDGAASFWKVGRHRAEVWRTTDWRLVRWLEPDSGESVSVELYDLGATDPEAENVAARHPEVVRRLTESATARIAELR